MLFFLLTKIIFISKFFFNESTWNKLNKKLLKKLICLKFEFAIIMVTLSIRIFSSYNHFPDLAVFKAFSAAFVFFTLTACFFSISLMIPTATVCLMSLTAKRPKGA